MTLEEIERLVRRLEETDVTDIDIADATSRLRLRFGSASGPPRPVAALPDAPARSPETPALLARAIGRLRLHHPEAAPAAGDGFPRAVLAGEIVAFLEGGPCLRPVVAERDCTIGPPLEAEGRLIGYGTPLFPIL